MDLRKQHRKLPKDASEGGGARHLFSSFFAPRSIVFGLTILHFLEMLLYIVRVKRQFEFFPDHWNTVDIMTVPFLLLAGSACILIGHTLTSIVAVLIAGRLIYSIGYLALLGVSNAHGKTILSSESLKIWFEVTSTTHLIQFALAIAIFILSAIQLPRSILAKQKHLP